MNRLIVSGVAVLVATVAIAPILHAQMSPLSSAPVISQMPAMVMSMGTFTPGEHMIHGSVQIVNENGQRYLEFSPDFQTDEGPDLVVILHHSADVIGSTAAPAHSLSEGDYRELAPIAAFSGTQRYAIPADVNLDDYGSVAIWCRSFNATFGSATLTP